MGDDAIRYYVMRLVMTRHVGHQYEVMHACYTLSQAAGLTITKGKCLDAVVTKGVVGEHVIGTKLSTQEVWVRQVDLHKILGTLRGTKRKSLVFDEKGN